MNTLGIIIRTWKFLYKHEKYRMLWGAGLIVTGVYATSTAWLSKKVIDSIIVPGFNIISGVPDAYVFGIAYGLVTLLQGYISSYSTVELLTIRDRTSAVTDELLMTRAAASCDITAFEIPETRDQIRLATVGARAVPSCFSGSVEVLQQLVAIGGLATILIYYHPLVAAVVFLPSIPLFYSQIRVRSHTFSALVHKSPKYRQMGYFIELMLGVNSAKEIRVYRSGNFFLNKYRQAADAIFRFERDHRWKATIATIVWGSVAAMGIGGAYLYIVYLAVMKTITVGDVVMYSGAVFYAGGSIRGLIQTASSLWINAREVGAFFAYVDHEPAISPGKRGKTAGCSESRKEWIVNNVSYSYPGRAERVLENVSFSIGAKEKVAIVGLNGAGKTTLLKLMLRLLDPDEGDIRFRGIDLKEWDVSSLRERFGVVFQDFARFKVTLYENIALAANGRLSSSGPDDAILKAAKMTGVDEIARASPRGYHTQLGKEFLDGADLSGGQWQRVALARGFVRDADVIFLDEPSASLDARTERELFEQVLALAQEKTAIIISHRLSITPMVDRVLVLEDGRLIEEGSHIELLERNGKYARMYETQARMYWPKAE